MKDQSYDYIIIGSGFGGSVAALRLAEKGYKILIIEKGKRWADHDYPKSNWQLKKYIWAPFFRWFGILQIRFLNKLLVFHGTGYGGGSLVYANTHMMPPDVFFTHPSWATLNNWKETLAPYYAIAKKMLGSAAYNTLHYEDKILFDVAKEMKLEHECRQVDAVGIYFGEKGQDIDPYFHGLGPKRNACIECAACMVGCRHNAKNTLDKNYLWLAENIYHAKALVETRVDKIEYNANDKLYTIHAQSSTSFWKKKKSTFIAKGIVVSAGVLGTMDLLLKQKQLFNTLPLLSDYLGHNLLTNSEMLSGVLAADHKLNHGIAISTVLKADDRTFIELCKFPDGSGSLYRLGVPAVDGGKTFYRIILLLVSIFKKPHWWFRSFFQKNLARNGLIFLIMQSLPNALKIHLVKSWGRYTLSLVQHTENKVQSFIAIGQEILYRYSKKANAVPHNAITEIVAGMASTAHVLGGCNMGTSKENSVIDVDCKVHDYPNFFILDGSIIQGNLGVNPSLTITAMAEYAMSKVPTHPEQTNQSLDEKMNARANTMSS